MEKFDIYMHCCLRGLGMSFGVKFKVRTFGNKHPDGSNVRNFSDHAIYYMYIYISVNRVLP